MVRVVMLLVLWAGMAWGETPLRVISVSGVGEVSAAPDMAMVSVGVEARARGAREALSAANEAMAAVFAAVSDLDIEPRDVQTTSVSLYPEIDHNSRSRPVVGYRAGNTVSIRVRQIARVGIVLDALSAAGANRIDQISFGFADRGPLEDAARRAAVANARAKAELYAQEAGVSIGALVSLTEGGAPSRGPVMMERMSMDAAAVPVAQGQMSVTARVSVVWQIE